MKNLALCRKCKHLDVTIIDDFYSEGEDDWRKNKKKDITNYSCTVTDIEDEIYQEEIGRSNRWHSWSSSSCSIDNKKQFRKTEPPDDCPYKMEHIIFGRRACI